MKRIVFALALLITSWSSASLTDGLVGYWPFDGDAKDYSGNGNHGVTHGVSLKANRDGHSDCAYSFGESDYITVPANSQLNAISDFTMCVWIKPTSWDNGYWLPIMCKGETRQYGLEITDEGCQDLIYHAEEEVHVSIDHNYKSCFEFYYERNSFLCTSHKLRIGEWMHIAATRSNGHLSVYINGTKIGSDTGANPPASNAGSLNIGRDPPGGMEYFHGLMDDVCLYNRALSAAEVSAIYNGGLKLGKVVFNANAVEVEGNMPSLSVLSGTQEKLPENAFRRHDGYVFQGWAKSKSDADNGIVKYQDEEEITIESDMTLYAVWASPSLTLAAESADWSSGSITLRCADADTSGAEHSYALEYCNENGTWVVVDDVQVSVTKGQNANNEEVWVVKLTDSAFSSRLGGIPPVQYHVKEVKSGRVSETCVTRNRHAIFVGLNEWQDTDLESTGGDSDANNFFNIAALRGGFSNSENIHVLLNRGAKVDDVDDAFDRVAESVQTGDIFLFYFRTHGGYDKSDGTTLLCLYDEVYTDTALATKIQGIEATGKSVAIIGIVAACHAGGMYDPDARQEHWYVANRLARCSANIAWIAAADREHASYAVFNKFLLDYGWEEGWAGNDTRLSFLELATYTKDRYESLLSGIKSYEGWEVQIENPLLLRNVMAGTRGSHANKKPPAAVTGIKSETGDRVDEIKTEWNAVDNADGYWLFCETGGVNAVCAAYSCRVNETEVSMSFQKLFGDLEFDPSKLPIKYSVKTVNGAGVSVASTVEVQNFARIVFDANGGGISGWRGALPREGIIYADITIGSILGGRLLTLPDAYGEDNKEFTGWFSVNGVQANPMAPIASDETYLAKWKAKNANGMTQDWLDSHQTIASASNGDIATAAAMTAANGCRTVGECYALGINPEDPNDDLRITDFKMENGKPVIKLNHTEDGSGNSLLPRVKTLGKADLSDATEEWRVVPEEGDQTMRFFKIDVEMP